MLHPGTKKQINLSKLHQHTNQLQSTHLTVNILRNIYYNYKSINYNYRSINYTTTTDL
jgi:hypothetical protein